MGDNSIVAAASANLCISDSIPSTGSNTWIIDTGASDHMTYDAKFFDELSSNTCDLMACPLQLLSKLDPYALQYVFIGYSSTYKGYKCYHQPTQNVHVTLDVTFHEEVPYYVSPSFPIQEERRSELESLELENLGLELENDAFKDTTLGKETTGHTEASNRSPIYEDETCGLSDETSSIN
ncbi:unnamed protein product [Prunus armeniaca]